MPIIATAGAVMAGREAAWQSICSRTTASNMTHATLPTLTVFYNTKCPVCNAGINHQKNRLLRAVRAGAIDFQDINLHPEALAPYGATLEDIRRRLHATDPSGTL